MDIPKISAELAEETGLHIGDGTMNFYKNGNKIKGSYALRGHIQDDKEHYQKRIQKLYQEIYGFLPSLRDMPSTGCHGFQKWSSELVTFKHKILGLPLGPKLDIKIPENFTKKFSIEVIKGIFDTDGNLYLEPKNNKLYPRIDISSISKPLALQIDKLSRALNLRSTVYTEVKKDKNWNNVHRVNLRGDIMVNKWFKLINPENPKHWEKYQVYINSS